MQRPFVPEGFLIDDPQNRRRISSLPGLQEASAAGETLEARATMFDLEKILVVELAGVKGIIPFSESSAAGSREIALLSRVGKPVCFKIIGFEERDGRTIAVLSRKKVQLECQSYLTASLRPGDVLDGCITHMERFGCFVDIGAGVTSLLPIDSISVSRISHPCDRFLQGQRIKCVIRSFDDSGRVLLTHKELLGSWEENAAAFSPGETVVGMVRSVESYGIFVELAANLAGLAEDCRGVRPGMAASVYIKSIIPDRMKIKLVIIDAFEPDPEPKPVKYFFEGEHMDRFLYSPAGCSRIVETVF